MRARSDRGICSAQSAGTRSCLLLHPLENLREKRRFLTVSNTAALGCVLPTACAGLHPGEQLLVWHSAAEPQLKRVFQCSSVWYPPIPSTLAIPTERKASARSNVRARSDRGICSAQAQVHETAYCCIPSKIFAKKEESHG